MSTPDHPAVHEHGEDSGHDPDEWKPPATLDEVRQRMRYVLDLVDSDDGGFAERLGRCIQEVAVAVGVLARITEEGGTLPGGQPDHVATGTEPVGERSIDRIDD